MTARILATLVTNLRAPTVHRGFSRGAAAAEAELYIPVSFRLSPADEIAAEEEGLCGLFCIVGLIHMNGKEEEIRDVIESAFTEAARREPSTVLLLAVPSSTLSADEDLAMLIPEPRPDALELDGIHDVLVDLLADTVATHIGMSARRHLPPPTIIDRARSVGLEAVNPDNLSRDAEMALVPGSL